MPTDVTQRRVQSVVTVSVGCREWARKSCGVIIEPRWTAHITVSTCSVTVSYLTFVQDANATRGPCSRTARCQTLPPWRNCDVSHVHWASEHVTCSWIVRTTTVVMLFGASFNKLCTASDDSFEPIQHVIVTYLGKLAVVHWPRHQWRVSPAGVRRLGRMSGKDLRSTG